MRVGATGLLLVKPYEVEKDFQDIECLVRIGGLDLASGKVRQWFLKYGNLELYERVVRACSND